MANLESVTLDAGLDSIERQSGVLDVLAGAGRKHDVGVERRVPASKEAALDLGVLGDAGLSNTLHGEGVLLEGSGQRVLASTSVILVQGLATSQTGASNGMAEGLGLGLGGRRSDKSGLSLGGGGGGGKERNLFANGASEVLESLLDIGRVVVSLVGILGAAGHEPLVIRRRWIYECFGYRIVRDIEHLLVSLLQGVHLLFEVDVVGGELGLKGVHRQHM